MKKNDNTPCPVYVKTDTHKKLRVHAAKEGITMTAIVEKALKSYFDGKE